jgi:hypothetical protein
MTWQNSPSKIETIISLYLMPLSKLIEVHELKGHRRSNRGCVSSQGLFQDPRIRRVTAREPIALSEPNARSRIPFAVSIGQVEFIDGSIGV